MNSLCVFQYNKLYMYFEKTQIMLVIHINEELWLANTYDHYVPIVLAWCGKIVPQIWAEIVYVNWLIMLFQDKDSLNYFPVSITKGHIIIEGDINKE